MNFTNDNIKELVQSIIPFIGKIAKKQTSDCLKVQKAIIVSSTPNNHCIVRLPNAEDDSGDFDVLNKYRFDVKAGDYVDLYYYDTLTNAYIGSIDNQVISQDLTVHVTSVNGRYGDVVISNDDIGAISFGNTFDLIWTNDNPGVSVPSGKTIEFPEGKYRMFLLYFASRYSDNIISSIMFLPIVNMSFICEASDG